LYAFPHQISTPGGLLNGGSLLTATPQSNWRRIAAIMIKAEEGKR
jgi:hypothetical protein